MNVDFMVGIVLGWLTCILAVLLIAYCYIDKWQRRLQAECNEVLTDIKSHGCIGYDNKGRDK